MKRTIECLNIKGFEYNPNIDSHVCSATYDKDDDTSIEIIPSWNNSDWLTIVYRYRCETIRVTNFLTQGDSSFWGEHLEHFIMEYMPSEMDYIPSETKD